MHRILWYVRLCIPDQGKDFHWNGVGEGFLNLFDCVHDQGLLNGVGQTGVKASVGDLGDLIPIPYDKIGRSSPVSH